MDKPAPRYRKHVFVCVHERTPENPRGCCAQKRGAQLRFRFVNSIREHHLEGKVRINKSGCLDACELGATVVIYPDNIWYLGVKEEDVEEIVNTSIINDGVVNRLLATEESWKRLDTLRHRTTIPISQEKGKE